MYAFSNVVPVPCARGARFSTATVPLARPAVAPAATKMVLSDHETKRRSGVPKRKLNKAPSPAPAGMPSIPDELRHATYIKSDMSTDGSADVETSVPLRITGNNVPLTESLQGYIHEKLDKVTGRYETLLTKVDVHLTVEHNHSIVNRNKIEVIAFIGKTILRAEVRAEDMYGAVDAIQARMARVIRKFKERSIANIKSQQKAKANKDLVISDADVAGGTDADQYMDIYAEQGLTEIIPGVPKVNDIVRRKVFPMPLQTVEEAVLCCEYVDHPWYLFRNAETREISLVYKRNHGGYGLIEPSNPNGKDEEQVL